MNLFINRLPVDLDEAKGIVGLTIFTTFWKTKIHIRCTTTKHGYQSKRTYGKVVHKQKMDSYIVGKKINPIRYCKILNVSRNLHILG
jgi:hypothetical protein